jgi:hypothetical protein
MVLNPFGVGYRTSKTTFRKNIEREKEERHQGINSSDEL